MRRFVFAGFIGIMLSGCIGSDVPRHWYDRGSPASTSLPDSSTAVVGSGVGDMKVSELTDDEWVEQELLRLEREDQRLLEKYSPEGFRRAMNRAMKALEKRRTY